MKIKLIDLKKINFEIKKWDIIFLYGDLWSWKTTLIKHILNNLFKIKEKIKSPTYIHYKKINNNIYHFDLYRLQDYNEFINIWWEEILDNKNNICFIEWPEIIENHYKPNIKINLKFVKNNENMREIEIN